MKVEWINSPSLLEVIKCVAIMLILTLHKYLNTIEQFLADAILLSMDLLHQLEKTHNIKSYNNKNQPTFR